MTNGTIAFDTLTTSDSKNTNTEKSIDTSYILNGVSKSWVDLDGSAVDGTADLTGVRDSFNLSSVVDNGTGDHTATFTNIMASSNYSTPSSVGSTDDAGAFNALGIVTKTTSTYRIDSESSSSNTDAARVDVAVFGDLA